MPLATIAELAQILDPPLTTRHVAALIWIHVIPSLGEQRGSVGHPSRLYSVGQVKHAHGEELHRTSKNFADSDWIASALIGREIVRTDTERGEIHWLHDGGRAERLGSDGYGWVLAARMRVAAHRVLWIAGEGEIPAAFEVNHINKLRWDNRRANLELTSRGENMRHMHGLPYLTPEQAIRELAELEPPEEPNPWPELMQQPGGHPAMPPGIPIVSQQSRSRVRRH